jgi:hypothetical protein
VQLVLNTLREHRGDGVGIYPQRTLLSWTNPQRAASYSKAMWSWCWANPRRPVWSWTNPRRTAWAGAEHAQLENCADGTEQRARISLSYSQGLHL